MGLIARNSGGGDFEQVAPGMYVARCWRVVDLGTVTTDWQGKPKSQHKALISFELLGDAKMEDGRPFTVSNRYTISLHEKAELRKMLESWRGRAFTAAELEGFDLQHILGKPCMVNVVHEEKNGKTYTNIKAVTPLPAGMTAPAAENKPYLFSFDEFDQEVFDQLSDGLKEKLQETPEYKALFSGASKSATNIADMDDDIPF